MMNRSVLSENPADFDLVERVYPYSSGRGYESEFTKTSIENLKRGPSSKMIIVNRDHANRLALVKKNFKELKDWKPNSKADFAFSIFLTDKTYLFILNNVKGTTEGKLKNLSPSLK